MARGAAIRRGTTYGVAAAKLVAARLDVTRTAQRADFSRPVISFGFAGRGL
jgi:hypothetical protein